MGIDYDCKCIFGISFSYNELKSSLFFEHDDIIKLGDYIGTYDAVNLWSEYGYIYTSPFYDCDEDECEYFIGYELKYNTTTDEMIDVINKKVEIINEIKNFCEKFRVNKVDIEPKFMVRPNVW